MSKENKTFVIGVTYEHADWYMVQANSEEEAITMVENGEGVNIGTGPTTKNFPKEDWIVRDNWKKCIICNEIHEGEHYHE